MPKEHPCFKTCFGKDFSGNDPVCMGCAISSVCLVSFSRRNGSEPPPEPDEPPRTTIVEESDISPFEHLVESLAGRYDRQDKSNNSADAIIFTQDGTLMAMIVISNTGRVRLSAYKFEKILDSSEEIETIREAEDIFRRMTTGR